MSIRNIIRALAVLLIAPLGQAFAAAPVTVLPFEGESVHPSIRIGAQEALLVYLRANRMKARPAEIASGPPIDRAKAEAAAKTNQTKHYLRGRMTRLGPRALIQVERYAVGQIDPEYTDRLVAATSSDLEPVLRRLAGSLAHGTKAETNQNIQTVTEREQSKLARRRANRYFSLEIGGLMAMDGSGDSLSGLGVNWLFDMRSWMADLSGHVYGIGADSTWVDLSIGGYYPLKDDDVSPYIGGGLSLSGFDRDYNHAPTVAYDPRGDYGYSDDSYGSSDSGGGLSAFASGGVIIGRTSNVMMRVDGRYFVSSYSVANQRVHGLGLTFSVGF